MILWCILISVYVLYLNTVTVSTQGCPQYWPEEGMLRYGPVQVECMSCSMDCDVISRLFRVCNLTRVSRVILCCYVRGFMVFLKSSSALTCLKKETVLTNRFQQKRDYFLAEVKTTWNWCVCCLTFQPQEGYLMVRQFQYLGWAGHREVPASKRSFLKLILQVDQWQREGEEGEGRTIVHCLWVHATTTKSHTLFYSLLHLARVCL